MEIYHYPETDHPPIEDIVDDLVNVKTDSFVYPEEFHPDLEDINHLPIQFIIDDSMDIQIEKESFVYPEEFHPDLEDIIEI